MLGTGDARSQWRSMSAANVPLSKRLPGRIAPLFSGIGSQKASDPQLSFPSTHSFTVLLLPPADMAACGNRMDKTERGEA
jgi:hypothetical protein